MYTLLRYFQGKTAKVAQIRTYWALGDVRRHLLPVPERLGSLFSCLSPQTYFKGLGGCRSLLCDRSIRFEMVKFGTVPEEETLGVRGGGTLSGDGHQAAGPAGGELRACVIDLPVVMSAEWPESWPVTTKLYGKNCPPCACRMEMGVKNVVTDTLHDVGCLASVALTDGLRGPFKVLP